MSESDHSATSNIGTLVQNLTIEDHLARPIFPTEVFVLIVKRLVMEDQYGAASALAQCSRAILKGSIPHIYDCVKLGSFGSLCAFLDSHPGLHIDVLAKDGASNRSSSGSRASQNISCRLSRCRLYHSSIKHLEINLRPPMKIDQSDLKWFSNTTDFPTAHRQIKLDSIHVTHQPEFRPYYPRQEFWLRIILRMFQAKHFRCVGRGVGHWVPVDRSLEICGRHLLDAWDFTDYLESIDIPVLIDKVPRGKFRWVVSHDHDRFLGSPLWSEIIEYLEDDVVLPSTGTTETSARIRYPTCLVYNAPDSFKEAVDWRMTNHLEESKRALARSLVVYLEEESAGEWSSDRWREWLRRDVWARG